MLVVLLGEVLVRVSALVCALVLVSALVLVEVFVSREEVVFISSSAKKEAEEEEAEERGGGLVSAFENSACVCVCGVNNKSSARPWLYRFNICCCSSSC